MNKFEGVPASAEAARAEMQYLYEQGQQSIRDVQEAGKPEILEVNGEKYLFADGRIERIKPVLPDRLVKPETFAAFSLDGLIDFIRNDVDKFFMDESAKCIVRVSGPTLVEVITPTSGYWKERTVLARCQATVPNIQFGEYLDPEDFQVMMLAKFHPSENRDLVLKLAGSIRQEQNIERADDGVSQRVTVNQGVATAANVTVKNPVYLIPMRTFPEVDQPESPFVLRFNDKANVALFSGDGGAWKLEAVAKIADYLRSNLMGCNVVVIG